MERSLLQRIEAFLKESAMPPSVFGRAAVRDPRLVSDLRGGREPGGQMICRLEHFMNNWRADRHAGRVKPIGDRRARLVRRSLGGAPA
ncbi:MULTISPECIES: hypothetical protein [unclassified Sphingopyxis]|uniref:hypothetical protein n=1 Tax=unclassified Sphingopyxis TaxID=2614943 RepID=UPI002864837E|nr:MULTISPECIES: hypothetical protein [unclassified Sphingopyxis]MDR6834313.1 hypothetical protein [Sphingopyxis sp. BE122]MDR7226582.1 hypothetical protein [Sphingopyxis sp. BE259]